MREIIVGGVVLSMALLGTGCGGGKSPGAVIPGEYVVKAAEPEVLTQQVARMGGELKRISQSQALYRVKLPQGESAGNLKGIQDLEPNYRVSIQADLRSIERVSDPLESEQWALETMAVNRLPAEQTFIAEKPLVAVIDTGVDWDHPDLEGVIYTNPGEAGDLANNGIDDDGNGYVDDVHGWNALGNNGLSRDDHGHGTHCSGVIGAVGGNGIGIRGIASVTILPIKFLDENGQGSTADAIEGIEYARKLGVRIMSNSWGGPEDSRLLQETIEEAEKDGVIFVASAGNSSENVDEKPSFPAAYHVPNLITVAATNSDDRFAELWPQSPWGSNFGPQTVHVGAPGVDIVSAFPGGKYVKWSGTSMAAPQVSGIAALLLSRNPHLSPDQIREILMSSSDELESLSGRVISGGRVNALKAVESLGR